jgi:uncharacterized membrane protein YfcA
MAALGHWPAASLPLVLPLVGGGFAGALVGQRLAPHLSDHLLRRGFAALLLGSALLSGLEAWRRHDPAANRTHPGQGPAISQAPPSKPQLLAWRPSTITPTP